ncbi:MAG: FtsB family cell division protein [Bacillota bacterium]
MLQRKEKIDYKDFKDPEKKENKNKNIILIFSIALILIGSLFAIQISQMMTVTHLSYKTEELENKLNTLEDRNKNLEIEVSKKISLSSIEKIAKNELGMVEAEKVEYMAINDNKPKNKEEKIQEENVSFVQGIHNFFKKLETVNASSP